MESCFVEVEVEMTVLAAPVLLERNETILSLSDYLKNPGIIDSVSCGNGIVTELADTNGSLLIKADIDNIPFLSELKVWIKGKAFSILLEKVHRVNKTIHFASNYKQYKTVQLAGDLFESSEYKGIMKNWDGIWETGLSLPPGQYLYSLLVDGKRMLDPANPDSIADAEGLYNSILTVNLPADLEPPVLSLSSFDEKTITIGVEKTVDSLFVFWENYRLSGECIQQLSFGYIVNIPASADFHKNSTMRVWAINEFGRSEELLIPLHLRKVQSSSDKED